MTSLFCLFSPAKFSTKNTTIFLKKKQKKSNREKYLAFPLTLQVFWAPCLEHLFIFQVVSSHMSDVILFLASTYYRVTYIKICEFKWLPWPVKPKCENCYYILSKKIIYFEKSHEKDHSWKNNTYQSIFLHVDSLIHHC